MKKQLCKLTDNKDQTFDNTQWGENVTHTTNGKGELCSEGWLHYYDSPLLAVLLNPIHANFTKPHLWKIKVGGTVKEDCGLKFGTTKVTTISRMKLPKVTTEQRIIFGILCAMKVYKDNKFLEWGNHWIDGSDRSTRAAWAAARAAEAARAAAWAVEAAAEAADIDLHALALKAISYK